MQIKRISNPEAVKFLQKNFSSPTHWPEWNELVVKYYGTEFYYLGYFERSDFVGICPFHQVKHKSFLKTRFSGQFRMIPNGGWIFSRPIELSGSFFRGRWNVASQVFSMPLLPELNVNYSGDKAIMRTLIVDLSQDEEEIWQTNLDPKKRNKVRKALKENIIIEKAKDIEGIKVFYALYEKSTREYHENLLPIDFFKDLLFKSNNIEFDIFLAKHNGQQIANVGIVSDNNYSFYWLGNILKGTRNLGQGDALQWHVIKEMKKKGCKYYDLCYIEPERLPGVYEFKKGFSNTEVPIVYFNRKSISYRMINRFL